MEKKRNNSSCGQALDGHFFLFQNCHNNCFSFTKNQNICEENFKLDNYVDHKTDIYSVSKFILNLEKNFKDFIGYYQLKYSNQNKNYFFSFTPAKLQKLIIISLFEYLRKIQTKNSISDSEISKYNPIKDMTSIINSDCGFSINYDFKKFGIDLIYDSDIHCDLCNSLCSLEGISNEDVFDYLSKKNQDIIDDFLFSNISESFKEILINTVIEFVLYPPRELGLRLNRLKNENWEKDQNLEIQEAFSFILSELHNESFINFLKN